jgi:HAD superfamily hydrolase (TIGR01549 family)
MIKAVLFDWGNTLMIDYPNETGPMIKWSKLSASNNAEMSLLKLTSKYKCYLATNARDSNKEEIKQALDSVGLGKYLSGIFCFKEIQYVKPSKEYFKYISNNLNINNDEMLLVGDDLQKDYYGSINNGLKSILYDPYNTCKISEVLKVNDLFDLYDIIIQ